MKLRRHWLSFPFLSITARSVCEEEKEDSTLLPFSSFLFFFFLLFSRQSVRICTMWRRKKKPVFCLFCRPRTPLPWWKHIAVTNDLLVHALSLKHFSLCFLIFLSQLPVLHFMTSIKTTTKTLLHNCRSRCVLTVARAHTHTHTERDTTHPRNNNAASSLALHVSFPVYENPDRSSEDSCRSVAQSQLCPTAKWAERKTGYNYSTKH